MDSNGSMKTANHLNLKTNNMQPFNLDRFKAGEPAYHKDTHKEHFYFGDLPDGGIVSRLKPTRSWTTATRSLHLMNEQFYMKEKKLTWDEVRIMWLKLDVGNVFQWLEENFEVPKRKNK
jgi:hypothetical protein